MFSLTARVKIRVPLNCNNGHDIESPGLVHSGNLYIENACTCTCSTIKIDYNYMYIEDFTSSMPSRLVILHEICCINPFLSLFILSPKQMFKFLLVHVNTVLVFEKKHKKGSVQLKCTTGF
jgi:hypothetical protein